MDNEIIKAVKVLNNGGIIIFPTDTAFGIGCRMDREDAVRRLFEIRKRPINQPVPILVDSIDTVREYVKEPRGVLSETPPRCMNIDKEVEEKLMEKYWPGGLTIVLPARIDKVLNLVRGGGDTIGVRMPDNETILTIIKQVGVPILGPSANFHGEQTPFSYSDLNNKLVKQVDYVLNGKCAVKKPSTVIDCTVYPWKIVREGAVNINIKNQISKIKNTNQRSKISKKNIVFIDTSSKEQIRVGLKVGDRKHFISSSTKLLKAQAVLPLIDKLLKKYNLDIKNIDKIEVNTGPGSYTGLKVGVAIANTLSFSLLKKINDKEFGDLEIPQY